MKEINDIIQAFQEAQQNGRQTALATVVHVEGSSYRRPGARMLVTDEGQLTGAISGGCLEGDALRKALFVMKQQKSMLVTYDTTEEDDASFGIGLGCNGVIQVLIEPVDAAYRNNPIELLKAISAKRQPAVLCTLFSLNNRQETQLGTCILIKSDEIFAAVDQDYAFRQYLLEDAQKSMVAQNSAFKNYVSGTQNISAFIEFVQPPVSLVIVGAGNDAIPLVQMAAILGWQTNVIDGRAHYASPGRFSGGCRLLVAKPAQALEQLIIDDRTVFVLMTHNYQYDLAMLKALLAKRVIYIGSLGPKKKLVKMMEDIKQDQIAIDNVQQTILFGPAGLDIGAETPEEIALSILAEIKAVLAGRHGGSLRSSTGAIHPRTENLIDQISISQ